MNAPLYPEVFTKREATAQTDLPLEAEGVLRYVWQSRFGDILIEVKEGQSFVNGQAVALAATDKERTPPVANGASIILR